MRAMVIEEFGEPSVLKMRDVPEPELGEQDLLIEVYATALNPVDTKVRRGAHGEKEFPLILGHDVSGVVRAVGGGVEHFQEGDEVYASPSLARHGANAEYVAVDARTVALKPKRFDHTGAAALPLATLTAWESLHDRAKIHPGETVLIHAGAGGVGHFALQLAKQHGCYVITTASRDESIALCERLGADLIINYQKEHFADRVMEETDGAGCPVVFDTVGGDVFDHSLDCIAINGRMVGIVLNECPRVVPALFRKNATLHMEFMAVPTMHNIHPEAQGEKLRIAAELADAGKLAPHIHKTVDLEDLPAAHKEQEHGHVNGKIVVKVKG